MDFNEKIQKLRKAKNLTQEELAQILYVSRTAVSKWESGRGYPNIDSLKEISQFFGVTIDDLLSGEELLTLAQEDNRQQEKHIRDLVFGILDCSAAMLFLLPFFGQQEEALIRSVSLPALTGIAPYVKAAYLAVTAGIVGMGILTLALQSCPHRLWQACKSKASMLLSVIGLILFLMGRQPYAAAFLLIFLIIKALMMIKWQ